MSDRRFATILAAALALASGCDRGSPNRSPTPEQDPARHARAVREAEDVQRANQEAEAAFYRRFGRVGEQLPGHDPADDAHAPTALEIVNHHTGADPR